MKRQSPIIVFGFLALLLFSVLLSGVSLSTVKADTQNTATVQLLNIGGGQTSLTNQTTHISSYDAKLVVPSTAPQGSGCMVLYPYNKIFNSLQSFHVYTSFTNAVPRFVISLDTNSDGLTDLILLSDYQFTSNGSWQITQGGQRWGWTEASPTLSIYGKTWNDTSYWKEIYGNATVLSVGVALEYWAVKDSNGLDQPLYADEAVINGVTYNIANQPSTGPTVDNWSMYRHDLQRTGKSTSAASNGNLLWKFNTGDKIRSSPSVVDGVVYQGSNDGYLYALNAFTGSVIWKCKAAASAVESSPAVANGVVYVGYLWDGQNGWVVALNATNGALIWRYATNSGVESSPAIVDGVVYIGSWIGYVYALNANNGALIWSFLAGGPVYSSTAVVNRVVYVGSESNYVYALNAATGALIWSFHADSQIYASPSVVDNVVYVNSDNGTMYALRANDGSEIWQAYIGSGTDHEDGSPAVAGGIVYVGARNGYYAFNASTGAKIWFFTSPYTPRQLTGYFYSSPAVAGNVVYCGLPDGYMFALNAFDGSIIWSYRCGNFIFASPAIANRIVYVGSYDGYVYALGTPSSSTPTPTPQPTAAPLPNVTSTPTPAPTATPTPAPTTQPTPTPNATAKPTPTPTPYQAPAQLSITQPTTEPKVAANQNQNNSDLLILAAIIITAVTALIYFVQILRNQDTN